MNKNIHEAYVNSNGKEWKKDGAYRMLRMLALFNEAYPDKDPKANEYWQYIKYNLLDPNDVVCSKHDKCDVCKVEGIVTEFGLGNYICCDADENDHCYKVMDEYYKNEIKESHKDGYYD